MSDAQDGGITRKSDITGEQSDFQSIKESIFQQNPVNVGIDLSRLSHTVTPFGSKLLESIDKQHGQPPQQHTLQLPQGSKNVGLPIANTKCGPSAGFFSFRQTFDRTTHRDNSSELSRLGTLPTRPERKLQLQRKGSLSPCPISTRHSSKYSSKEPRSRHQPYSTSSRQKRERSRTWSLPSELTSGASNDGDKRESVKRQWDVKKVEFPHNKRLVPLIFSSHPRYSKEIAALGTKFRINVIVQEKCDHLTVQLEGHPKGISKAENELSELVKHVQDSIHSELVAQLIACVSFPTLVTQQMLSTFAEIEKKNRVNILVCRASANQLPLNSEEITRPFSSPESVPKLADFKDFIIPVQPVHTKYKWQVENDSGEFEPVSSEVEIYINQCYCSGLPQFSYNGKHYALDFVGGKLHETDTGVIRKLLKEPLPPVWSYCLGNELGFIDFEPHDSEALENLLLYGGSGVKVLHIQKGTVDFENMALVNLSSLLTEPLIGLQRSPCLESGLPTYGIRLAIEGLEDDIHVAKHMLREKLQSEFSEKNVSLPDVPLEQQHKIRTQMVNNARQYFVDIATSEDNGQVKILIKGEQKHVSDVHLQLQKDNIELQQHLVSQDRQQVHSHRYFAIAVPNNRCYPKEWKPQTKSCEIQDVAFDSVEWNGVLSQMRTTMQHDELLKVERIQNRPLWDKYALEMVQMEERNRGDGTNEKLLFHGTRDTDPKLIVESVKGIDFRYSNQHRNLLWGKGAYFAVNASYSDNYSHDSGNNKQMLLVRVLTGRSCSYGTRTQTNLTKPPPLKKGGTILYDTVNGHTNGSDVYVVYDHDRAYPAYLITYK